MHSIHAVLPRIACLGAALAAASAIAATPPAVVLGTSPYLKLGDSAMFGAMSLGDDFYWENFEDGAANSPGLSIVGGFVMSPSPITDSVDADDGVIDGAGFAGRSYRAIGSAAFAFTAGALGGLPKRVAFAWTDGEPNSALFVTVTTGLGASFVSIVGPLGLNNPQGGTAEDRLIWITSSDGVLNVSLSDGGGQPFEIDHIQYENPLTAGVRWNRHDLNADGKDDLTWFKPLAAGDEGKVASWLMNGLVRQSGGVATPLVPAGYLYQGMGAADDGGKPCLVWRDEITGLFHFWKMNGQEATVQGALASAPAMPGEWDLIAVADVDGDLDADLVFRHVISGLVNVWLVENFTKVGGGLIGSAAGLTFVGCGDLNGDRRQDLLWRAPDGSMGGWLLNGLTVLMAGPIDGIGAVPATWNVGAVTDLDGDRCDDIVWRNSADGTLSGWRMAGLSRAAGGAIAVGVSPAWELLGARDLNGDGRGDLVWRHLTTQVVNAWLMDGLTKTAGGYVWPSGPGWGICN